MDAYKSELQRENATFKRSVREAKSLRKESQALAEQLSDQVRMASLIVCLFSFFLFVLPFLHLVLVTGTGGATVMSDQVRIAFFFFSSFARGHCVFFFSSFARGALLAFRFLSSFTCFFCFFFNKLLH
jgi:hypothetical protein